MREPLLAVFEETAMIAVINIGAKGFDGFPDGHVDEQFGIFKDAKRCGIAIFFD